MYLALCTFYYSTFMSIMIIVTNPNQQGQKMMKEHEMALLLLFLGPNQQSWCFFATPGP